MMWMQDHHAAFAASVAAHPLFPQFRSLSLVQALSANEAMLLFSCLSERKMSAGSVVYEAGTTSKGIMYLILDGEVTAADAGGQAYTRLLPGDVFGLFSFLDPVRAHSATIRCITDVTCLCLDRPYFDIVSLEDPALGGQLLRFMFRLLSRMALKLEVEYAALRHYALGEKPAR